MRKLLPLAAIASLLLVGAGCTFGGGQQAQPDAVTLEYWRTEDDPASMTAQIDAYQKLHPHVKVEYRQFRTEDYERTLREAFAENRAPDLFSIPNVWLTSWKANIQPMPKATTMPVQEVNAKKEVVTVMKETPAMNVIDFTNRYVEGVTRELVGPYVATGETAATNRIFGIPLSADTLGMFYNREMLKRGNMEQPPATWRDLQEAAIKLTIFEEPAAGTNTSDVTQKAIKQSGAAIGLGRNVDYRVELLSALMMQNGARMADDYGYAAFTRFTPETEGKRNPPGVEALMFYQSFALPGSENFSWDATLPQSLDAFITGKTAIYFGLPADTLKIRERAPRLDFGIAPLPQVDPSVPVNALRYPVEVVARTTQHPDEAWDFLQYMAMTEQVSPFLAATKRPTSLRGLIQPQLADADIGPFAGQVLTGKGWYKGQDFSRVESAFTTMIESYPTFERPEYLPIVARGADAVNQTIRR